MYSELDIRNIVESQRRFFRSGRTLPVEWRLEQLRKLKKVLIENEDSIKDALKEDLGRSGLEAYLCDIGPVVTEINETLRGLRRWSRPERHLSGLVAFPSIFTKVYKSPYGVTLIISPFNFPFVLSLGVLQASISAGNTAVIKASSKSSRSTQVLKKIITDTFPAEYITVLDGGHEVADYCLEQSFDKIFYTGSPQVAKHVMSKASENLTPVALELGGENGNWCIIRKDADLKDAARKIAFFKLLNSGQICININQVAVAREVADEFIGLLRESFVSQIGSDPVRNEEYAHMINSDAFDKCMKNLEPYSDRIVFGGHGDRDSLRFEPTVIYPVGTDEEIVMKELFSPILPVVPFDDGEIDDLLETIGSREKPLAMYVFTKDLSWAEKTMRTMQFGGGCINEVCVHMMVKGVPFNGVGHSGMGAYHGRWGFNEFTHPQTVLTGSSKFNLSLREHPYSGRTEKAKEFLIRLFER